MPVLSNQRHERFAQELAKGKTADEAYQLAGYDENRGNASRLKANENVASRVVELQQNGAKRAEVTAELIQYELLQARALALKLNQPAAAVAASMGRAKVAGLIVEQRVTRTGPLDEVPADVLERVRQELVNEHNQRADRGDRPEAQGKPH